jgi:iron complex transport system substrate-binding protein
MIPRLLRRGAWLFRPKGRGLIPQWSKDEAGRGFDADGKIEGADKNVFLQLPLQFCGHLSQKNKGTKVTAQFFKIIGYLCFSFFIQCHLIASPPKRVVSQAIGTDDILLALADPSQIAALSHLARDPALAPDAANAVRYPALKGSSAEDVLRFRPDLVLLTSFSSPETVAILKKSRVKLFILEKFETLDDVYASLRQLGDLLEKRQKAEALIESCRARVGSLAETMKGVKRVRVISAGAWQFISGSNTSFQDICDHAGAINVAAEAGIDGIAPLPSEKLLTWKIDALVGPTERRPNGSAAALTDRLKDVIPYRFLDAYKQGRVIEIPVALFMSTSHHRIAAFEVLARALHPERFAGILGGSDIADAPPASFIWWQVGEQGRLPDGRAEQAITLMASPGSEIERREAWIRIRPPKLTPVSETWVRVTTENISRAGWFRGSWSPSAPCTLVVQSSEYAVADVLARAEIQGRTCFAQTCLMLYGMGGAAEVEDESAKERPSYPEFRVLSNGSFYWPQTGDEFNFNIDGGKTNGDLEVWSDRGERLETIQALGDDYKYTPPHDPALNRQQLTASKPLIFVTRLEDGGSASFTQLVHRSRDAFWNMRAGLAILAASCLVTGLAVVLIRRKARPCC